MRQRARRAFLLPDLSSAAPHTHIISTAPRVVWRGRLRRVALLTVQEENPAVAARRALLLPALHIARQGATGGAVSGVARRCAAQTSPHRAWPLAMSASALNAPRNDAAMAPWRGALQRRNPHARAARWRTANSKPAISLGCHGCMPSTSARARCAASAKQPKSACTVSPARRPALPGRPAHHAAAALSAVQAPSAELGRWQRVRGRHRIMATTSSRVQAAGTSARHHRLR